MRSEIKIAGFGGQGIVLAGYILGKAFALYAGLEAVMTQSYGPEARGGATSANLIVSDEPIDYPFVLHPDFLIVLSQEAYTKFRPQAREEATILIDDELVVPLATDSPFCIPATRFAEKLGRRIVANIIMLGFFTAVTGLIERQALEKAIAGSVRPRTLPLNEKAFAAGWDYGQKAIIARSRVVPVSAESNEQLGGQLGGVRRAVPKEPCQ